MITAAGPFSAGTFSLGCNYWASNAGAFMWRDWQPDVVEADLQKLAAHGIQWLRVFPLWPDFQPITQLRGQNGKRVEVRLGEEPLAQDEIGRAGLSRLMLDRFAEFCRLSEKYDLKLVVGLITGWMSGRLFVPPALEGLNPITDATSIAWQMKFVRAFVAKFKTTAAVVAWDLGNECNCMGEAPTPDAAYLWTAAIANAIRAADASRPVVSGMHSLSAPTNNIGNSWLIDDQASLTDILTTHPYPYWVRHTSLDAVDDFRTSLHATAETRFYSDIGGKPAIAEEIGTMGPMIASDEVSAGFARCNMFSLWANDCRAMAWWCAHDQTELAPAPYDWNGVELELGLLRTDGTAKPVLTEMSAFGTFLRELPFASLTKPQTEAICLLTKNQDDWAVAFGSYVLAKQAKLELSFRHIEQPIPVAQLYMLPSITGADCVPRRKWLELLERVKAGATLYMSLADGIVPAFNAATGVELISRARPSATMSATLSNGEIIDLPGGDDLVVQATTAEVLGVRTDTGTPAYWKNALGNGEIHVFASPIEGELTRRHRAFSAKGADPYWRIYRDFAARLSSKRMVRIDDPDIAVTEHRQSDGTTIICAINHTPVTKRIVAALAPGATVGRSWRGTLRSHEKSMGISIEPWDAVLFELLAAPVAG